MTTENEQPGSETETGLPNDVDAWIKNAKFGEKDEYKQAVVATGAEGGAFMLLLDLVDASGDLIGSQGYSIGSGWILSDDGMSISHPKRKNVVGTSMYGLLQNRVVKELKVDMQSRGIPTEAGPWNGLGFHWLMQPHMTVGGQDKPGLMPVEFLSAKEAGAPSAKVKAPPPAVEGTTEKALAVIARTNDQKTFQEKALAMASVASDDVLMAKVLDESAEGFWATHQAA